MITIEVQLNFKPRSAKIIISTVGIIIFFHLKWDKALVKCVFKLFF